MFRVHGKAFMHHSEAFEQAYATFRGLKQRKHYFKKNAKNKEEAASSKSRATVIG